MLGSVGAKARSRGCVCGSCAERVAEQGVGRGMGSRA